MHPALRVLAASALTLVAPPVGLWVVGRPRLALAWLALPVLIAALRLSALIGVTTGVVLHDPLVLLTAVLWLVTAVAVGVLAARAPLTGKTPLILGAAVLYVLASRVIIGASGVAVHSTSIASGGMAPTLLPGDAAFVLPGGPVEVGDVVQLRAMAGRPGAPPDGYTWIRRVVATEGMTVAVEDHQVIVDGVSTQVRAVGDQVVLGVEEACEVLRLPGVVEKHGDHSVIVLPGRTGASGRAPEITVPPGHVYVLGDHRDRSMDSRRIGPVPVEAIEGRLVAVTNPVVLSPCPRLQLGRVGGLP